ncbi:MAG: hypothetical protein JO010_04325, partial [Alphaproteobacteria bacterium]|nr:hypothetical protein [Alphaproteobacteria bacterium]
AEGQRQIVEEGALLAAGIEDVEKAARNKEYIEKIKAKGVQVYFNSPAEKEQFKKVAQGPVLEYIQATVGKPLVDELLAEVERAKKAVYVP